MKSITLWQPWATLIAIGVKTYETRSWSTRYRGPLAIHAAKTTKGIDQWLAGPDDALLRNTLAAHGLYPKDLPLGVVVCTTRLVEVVTTEELAEAGLADPWGDYRPGRYGWIIADIEPIIPPVPATGRQGFWDWER